ncbi:MAG: TetR family transcriptional regulator [Alphaproteobacteria bacterium]|nr:TetR family transcriptional regulator [Alphaproteobacteria bacterium]
MDVGGTPEAGLDFAAVLLRAAGRPSQRKSERTRFRLLAAAAACLARGQEPGQVRVADIAAAAGVAHGTFYRYFGDRGEAMEILVNEFARFLRERLGAVQQGAPASPARVRAATLAYLRLFRANIGLMRCLMNVGPESASYRERFHALNRDWNGKVAAAIAMRRARGESAETLLPTAYALGGMVDEFLAQLYLRRDPALGALAADEEAVAELLTALWCRGAYGSEDR